MEHHGSLYTAAIASGSNGNCYYVGNDQEAVLIDLGISCRELERRMARMGLRMDRVKAIFISHEHTDHVRGLTVVANKYQLPVFITEETWANTRLAIPSRLIYWLRPGYDVSVGRLQVTHFSKPHDAIDPQSFVVRQETRKVGVFTDIGAVCDSLIEHFQQCDVAFLESNYDTDMLEQGRYPYFLKNRIRGGQGHLSNQEALELFIQHRPAKLKLLFLCHLSKDNNDPKLVEELFSRQRNGVQIEVARRDSETRVFKIPAPMRRPQVHEFHLEQSQATYDEGGVITTYESCTIRWRVQSV